MEQHTPWFSRNSAMCLGTTASAECELSKTHLARLGTSVCHFLLLAGKEGSRKWGLVSLLSKQLGSTKIAQLTVEFTHVMYHAPTTVQGLYDNLEALQEAVAQSYRPTAAQMHSCPHRYIHTQMYIHADNHIHTNKCAPACA